MADGVLYIVANRVLGWFGTAVAQEIGLLLGVEEEFQGLKNTLRAITAVLRVAEKKKQVHDERIKIWLEGLEDAMDEADVLMDELSYEDLRRQVMPGNNKMKKVRTFFSSSNQVAFRRKMASRIRDLKKKLDKIQHDTEHFHFDALPPQEETNVGSIERDTHSFVNEKIVIGRNEEKEALIELLLDTKNGIEEDVSVLPIVGAGGLGKTTLVQMIFNDSRVQEYFDLKIWVCVSDDFDVKLIVGKILKFISDDYKSSTESPEMVQLQKDLHKGLNGKRYLLVLDDVWNENIAKWHNLKDLLQVGAHGSMIVLTSRNQKVAEVTSTRKPFTLGILDEERSWLLFREMAFVRGQEPGNSSTVEIGKKIVKKCGGVPLVIKAIGRMLYFKNKNQEMEWLSLVDKELLEISHDEDDDIILPTLKLSYDHLPAFLKQCFTCCSLFPKDYVIKVDMLIKLWMAQGFIKSTDPNECLEEVGREYFMELYGRSFFQEVERNEDFGDITSCKMHDLMHDLATSLAEKKCMTLDLSKQSCIDGEARHLSFDLHLYSPTQIPASWIQAKRLRSILMTHYGSYGLKEKSSDKYKSFYEAIVLNFKSLRLLDLQALPIERVPKSMGDLRFLRYLDLSGNDEIETLPNSVTRLLHLQTLKLNGCWRLKELPRDIKRLVNLRHLEIRGCKGLTHMPRGLGQLTNLQTLSKFVLRRDASSAKLSEVAALINLRGELEVRNLRGGVNAEGANLKDKKGITSLVLHWDGDVADFDKVKTLEGFQLSCWGGNLKRLELVNYMGLGFPSNWLPSSFSNLVIFRLTGCNNCQRLPPLDQFPSLKELILVHMNALEHIIENGDSLIIMPSLRELYLRDLPNLKSWWRKDDWLALKMFPSFPALLQLTISDCPQLNSMPLYPYVEDVTLENSSLKPLEETLLRESSYASSSSSSSAFSPLSNLRSLKLYRHENVESVADNLMKSLTSLKDLDVRFCPKLKKLQFHHLTSLQSLRIWGCKELIDISNDVDDEDAWRGLRNLRSLTLRSLKKLVGLPEGLQHVTSLQTLSLWGCESLIGIPEWIGNCNSLRELVIVGCPNLTTLPHAISNLTSLHTLRISHNPILLERCKRETGEDWHKIEHIPNYIPNFIWWL